MADAFRKLRINAEAFASLSPAEREAVNEELRVVEGAVKDNPLLMYEPHGKQREFHRLPHPPTRAFFGGNRSGKTTATMVDTIIQAVDREVLPAHLRRFRRWDETFFCRVITPDLTNTLEGVVLQKFREWCPRKQFKGGSFDRAWDKQLRMLHFRNGNWVQFFSNDQDLDKFGGAALHRIVYDEEPRADVRRECLMRLIDYGGEEIFGMTPLHGMSWTYDEIYEPWERDALRDGRVVVVDMDDNPHLDEDTKTWVLQGLSSEERQARKSGRFVSFAGLIFPQFQTSSHVIPSRREVPAGVEVFCGIDPGYRHMCGVVYAYLDEQDQMVVFDEIAMQGSTVKEVCAEIQKRNVHWGVSPNWYVIDPAARNKNNQTGRSDQQEFADNGVVTIPGQNAVAAGINRVRERLEANKLLVMAHCSELRGEFKRYRWVRDSGRSEDEPRERPVKKDDHCFVAGTMVATERGERPIESLRAGDLVWTRQGLFPVVLARRTRENVDTRVLTLEDGRELRGTPDHPVYVSGKGFTRLDAVRYGDRMLVWRGEKKSCGTGSSSTVTPTRQAAVRPHTLSPRLYASTGLCGSSTTGQSLPAITSTTSTETPGTTTSQTLSSSRPATISVQSIGATSGERRREPGCATLFDPPASSGTALRTGLLGIANMPVSSSVTVSRNHSFVSSAGSSSRARSEATFGSALTTASRRGDAPQAWTTKTGCAASAERLTGVTSTQSPVLAPLRVVANSPAPRGDVHSLTVLGPPEYFAAGLLVRNCLDALRYVCMQRPLVPEQERVLPTDTFKQRILKHSLKRLAGTAGVRSAPDAGFGPGQFS